MRNVLGKTDALPQKELQKYVALTSSKEHRTGYFKPAEEHPQTVLSLYYEIF
jgi:hypothetical protein